MEKIAVTLSANAGVSIRAGGIKIWVDALYSDSGTSFSSLSPQLRQQVLESEAFANPDVIFYTHCHGDHYCRELAEEAHRLWPNAKLIVPEQKHEKQILLTGKQVKMQNGNLQLRFIKLPHALELYADVALYGLMISLGDKTILLPGDCEVADPALAEAVGDTPIDLAIVDFPWITKAAGKAFLQQTVRPKKVIAYHLPFVQDDAMGFRQSAQRNAATMEQDVQLLCDPLQTIETEI